MSVDALEALMGGGVIEPVCEVTSWLGGESLGEIPVTQGQVTEAAGDDVLGRLELMVESTPEWRPTHPGHPLAAYGQELVVRRGFRTRLGETVGWVILGRFRIWSSIDEGQGWVRVQADSVDVRLTGARWLVDTRTTGTFAQQIRQICAGIVPVQVAVTDRPAVARLWEQQGSRREALFELCDAFSAVPRMVDGRLTVVPLNLSTVSTMTVRDGDGGTLVSCKPGQEHDMAPNVVVASTAPTDETAPLSSMAAIRSGPRAFDGPFGQWVQFYSSPVLTTMAQCQAAANTRLARLSAATPDITVEAVTDPRVRLDAVVRAVDEVTATDVVARVTEVTHALTAGMEPGGWKGQVLFGQIGGVSW